MPHKKLNLNLIYIYSSQIVFDDQLVRSKLIFFFRLFLLSNELICGVSFCLHTKFPSERNQLMMCAQICNDKKKMKNTIDINNFDLMGKCSIYTLNVHLEWKILLSFFFSFNFQFVQRFCFKSKFIFNGAN